MLLPQIRHPWLLLAIMLLGLAARIPGIFWGLNYPSGWTSHYIDEYTHLSNAGCLINPAALRDPSASRYLYGCASYYPKGLAAHVALPILVARGIRGRLRDNLPTPATVITIGRAISVLYGVATILVVFLLARMFFPTRPMIAYLSALLIALGGIHVAYSHFFVPDVPVLFWSWLCLYLIARSVEGGEQASSHYLNFAALCLGIAFGIKLSVQALPSLVAACILLRPSVTRLVYAAVFLAAGFCVVNMDAFSLYDLYGTTRAYSVVGLHGYHFSRLAGAGIYLLELPSIISFPVALLVAGGAVLLAGRLFKGLTGLPVRLMTLVFVLPNLAGLWFVLLKADNAPRHLLLFVPTFAIAAAWALTQFVEFLARYKVPRLLAIAPVFLYLAVFVFDGERVFWRDPRNDAVRWLLDNVPKGSRVTVLGTWRSAIAPEGYTYVDHQDFSTADVIVSEMHYANMFLSGMGWRDSYPQDISTVWPWFDEKGLHAWQALFKGTSSFTECARFSEGYFMPEYVWTDRLIGNRMRNFMAEVVIFRRIASKATS